MSSKGGCACLQQVKFTLTECLLSDDLYANICSLFFTSGSSEPECVRTCSTFPVISSSLNLSVCLSAVCHCRPVAMDTEAAREKRTHYNKETVVNS